MVERIELYRICCRCFTESEKEIKGKKEMKVYEESLVRASRLGKNLKRIRESKGLSQTELGDLAGMSNVTISRIECGKTLANIFSIIQLTMALNTTFEELTK